MAEIEHIRIDRWLWVCRFFKTRTISAKMVERGKVRVNGRKLKKSSALVRIDDVITLSRENAIITVKVLSLPICRGSAKNSENWYKDI